MTHRTQASGGYTTGVGAGWARVLMLLQRSVSRVLRGGEGWWWVLRNICGQVRPRKAAIEGGGPPGLPQKSRTPQKPRAGVPTTPHPPPGWCGANGADGDGSDDCDDDNGDGTW